MTLHGDGLRLEHLHTVMHSNQRVYDQPIPGAVIEVIVGLLGKEGAIHCRLFDFCQVIAGEDLASMLGELALYPISDVHVKRRLLEGHRQPHLYVVCPILVELVYPDAPIRVCGALVIEVFDSMGSNEREELLDEDQDSKYSKELE